MKNFIEKGVYSILPLGVQNIGISIYGLYWKNRRLGGKYREYLGEFKNREYYDAEQWRIYQSIQLQSLLVHAYHHVPYYVEIFKELKLKEKDLLNFKLSDLKFLPYLEKDALRQYGTNKLMSNYVSKGSFVNSSGSTGTPVSIYLSKDFHRKWSAIMETRIRNWAGVSIDNPRGMIGGRRIIPNHYVKYPLYRYNIFEKQTYFSAYHLSLDTVQNYIDGLVINKVEYLTGYAVSIFLLSKFALESSLKIPKLKAVITSSEKLTQEMKYTISEAFKCRVYDSYSGVESCGLISETPEGKMVFSPDSGILEVLDENGSEVGDGQVGEVVLTGLYNYDQPLIRYKIGDSVEKAKNQKLDCGREMIVIEKILGRTEDIIYGGDGRAMVRFHSLFYSIPGLKLSQIIQDDIGEIRLRLVCDEKAYDRQYSENLILKRLESQLGNTNTTFEYVDEIEKSANGKHKAVINNQDKK